MCQLHVDVQGTKGSQIAVDDNALWIKGSTVGGLFSLRQTVFPTNSKVRVEFTSVDTLADDLETPADETGPQKISWPASASLAGFRFNRLISAGDATVRSTWLDSSHQEEAAYDRVAQFYRDHGSNSAAAEVEVKKYNFLWSKTRSRTKKLGGWFIGCTVEYGYRPFKALYSIAMAGMMGSVFFGYFCYFDPKSKLIVPFDSGASAHYPPFSPIVFSFEVLLPFIKLGQQDAWLVAPAGTQGWRAYLLRWYYRIHVVLGYILAALFLVALSPDGPARLNALWTW